MLHRSRVYERHGAREAPVGERPDLLQGWHPGRPPGRPSGSRLSPPLFITLGPALIALALVCAPGPAQAACLVEGGAPTCGGAPDPGSTDKRITMGQHVGNPVDVITGNKYQAGDDYRSPDSPLAFTRHYNSSLIEHDIGLGPGWRHSYDVVLSSGADGSFRIVQSDGRRIEFAAEAVEGVPNGSIHLANSPGDGYLLAGSRRVWYPDDGRAYTFNGPYLVRIDYPDKQTLTLRYQQRRLRQITDSSGRTLRLSYADQAAGLGRYGDPAHVPAGHLEKLQLPDGSSVRYRYDSRLNLVAAIDDVNSRLAYHYDDPNWPSHLGAITDDGNESGRWKYDETGRAVTWRSSDSGDHGSLTYLDDARLVDVGQTRVLFAGGYYVIYHWATAADGTHFVTSLERTSEVATREVRRQMWDNLNDFVPSAVVEDKQTERSTYGARPSTRRTSHASPIDEYTAVEVTLDDGRQVTVSLAFDRLGDIYDIGFGNLRFQDVLERAKRMPKRRRIRDMEEDESYSFENRVTTFQTAAEASHVTPENIELTLLTLIELGEEADRELTEQSATGPPPVFRSKQIDPNGPVCPMPTGINCVELRDQREMAELSACAYSGATCNTGFQRVDPVSLGMNTADFVVGELPVYLYHDSAADRYILAFRGTENGQDIYEDGRNLVGISSSQYSEAIRLGERLSQAIIRRSPDSSLIFTGHSLGGGLATVAALRTERSATIFNAASVTRGTARWLDLDLGDRGTYVHNVRVEDEAVSRGQRVGQALNSLFGAGPDSPGPFPGSATSWDSELPQPPAPWIEARRESSSVLSVRVERGIVLHSMEAVIYSLDYLLDEHCTP